jgi:hypothetical protein
MMLSGAVAAVYLVTALPVLAGQKFSEPNTGFDVEFPDGWRMGRSPNIPVPNLVGVLEAGADRALCVVTAQDVAASRGAVADVNRPPDALAHTVATYEPSEEERETVAAAAQKNAKPRTAAGKGAAQP